MKKAKKALVIVDMLKDFMETDGALYCGDKSRKIIPFVKNTIAGFRKNKDLVLYVKDSHKRKDKEFDLFGKHCVAGTKGSQIIKEIKPKKGERVVLKTTYDAAFKSNLAGILKKHAVRDVFLVGVCTSICVMETASSLTKFGFRINVLKKGVADFDAKAHAWALKRMSFLYGAKII